MPIFTANEKSLLFIHIPKTGGTSLESCLAQHCEMSFYSTVIPRFMKCSPQHLSADDYIALCGQPVASSFAVVRNPYDRLESEYLFRTRAATPNLEPDFNVWLAVHLDHYVRNSFHLDNHLKPQVEFVSYDSKIFRYEDGLDPAYMYAMEYLGIDERDALPRLNPGSARKIEWTLNSRNRVNEMYGADFEEFGYDIVKARTSAPEQVLSVST